MGAAFATRQTRQRVPAAERRDALVEAAMHEFVHGGLHGTPLGVEDLSVVCDWVQDKLDQPAPLMLPAS